MKWPTSSLAQFSNCLLPRFPVGFPQLCTTLVFVRLRVSVVTPQTTGEIEYAHRDSQCSAVAHHGRERPYYSNRYLKSERNPTIIRPRSNDQLIDRRKGKGRQVRTAKTQERTRDKTSQPNVPVILLLSQVCRCGLDEFIRATHGRCNPPPSY